MADSIGKTQYYERIGVLDFLRGIAVLGILLINIESFSYPDPWSPFKYGYQGAVDHQARFWVYFFAQGKFFSMFTLLFGTGFYIFLDRLERKGAGLKGMDIYARRLFWLFIFGLIHAYLIWNGDVLYHYAICGFLLFPFRSFSVRQLLLVITVLAGVLLYNDYRRAVKTNEQYRTYREIVNKPAAARSADDRETLAKWERRTSPREGYVGSVPPTRQTYWQSIEANAEHPKVHEGAIFYKGILIRTLIMMLLGVVLIKSGVFHNYRTVPYYWPATLALLAVALAVNYMRYYHWTFTYYEPVTQVWKAWLFTFPKELSGLAYILFINGLYQKFMSRSGGGAISAAGRMALSNYIFQSILCGLIFYGYGFGVYGHLTRSELLLIVPAIWLVQLVLSRIWLARFKQGPLESLWRRLTYGK